jgi:DNA-binding NarL/FixJ family response regulator
VIFMTMFQRERQIVALIACGETDKQIAARFRTRPATVRHQVMRLKQKIAVPHRLTSRAQLVEFIVRRPWLERMLRRDLYGHTIGALHSIPGAPGE